DRECPAAELGTEDASARSGDARPHGRTVEVGRPEPPDARRGHAHTVDPAGRLDLELTWLRLGYPDAVSPYRGSGRARSRNQPGRRRASRVTAEHDRQTVPLRGRTPPGELVRRSVHAVHAGHAAPAVPGVRDRRAVARL